MVHVYELEPPRRASSRLIWLVVGAVTLLVVAGCGLLLAVSAVMPGRTVAQDATLRPVAQAVLPTPTPKPVAAAPPVAAPAAAAATDSGYDYESAVLMNIYDRVNASVVNVSILNLGSNIHIGGESGLDPDRYYEAGSGSGFVWDLEGHIVTNNHVVEGADRVIVRFSDGTMSPAEVVGADADSDLAVVQVQAEGYTLVPVARGNLDDVRVGQRVAAIGNPFGLEGTLTTGIVSAIGRSIPARASFSIPASIQTDAPINPGNSGGPLLNEQGEVIGVNAQIRSDDRANSGVGFAIPIAIVERVVPALIETGSYEHPYMGVSGATFSPICAGELGLDANLRGAIVLDVIANTPADRAGLRGGSRTNDTEYQFICPEVRGGDVITAVNGEPVTSFDAVLAYLQRYSSPGDTITLTILRDGEYYELDLTLTARPQM
jgi:2-alkenal reductase